MELDYSYKTTKKHAKAQGKDIDASFKKLTHVCSAIRGRGADEALAFLERAMRGEEAIWFRGRSKRKGHRKELGGKKGGFPTKYCKIVFGVLSNAVANGVSMELKNPVIVHVSANKQNIYPRLAPKGRRARSNYETARVEIVLEEGG